MDLKYHRESDLERRRTNDLVRIMPFPGVSALDAGARDGHFSKILVEKYDSVTALDLEEPCISHTNIDCVQGDITDLCFEDDSFDLVLCLEVLEHIPSSLLSKACDELSRVTKKHLLIGVPYKQDIRVGRTTCSLCGKVNPPWGHVNSFDENRLEELFASLSISEISYVGINNDHTNLVATFLMDIAGNPYGTYTQEESCIHCNGSIGRPRERNILKKVATKAAFYINYIQKPFMRPHANWIHILFEKA